jgi:hypothetical protein
MKMITIFIWVCSIAVLHGLALHSAQKRQIGGSNTPGE